MQNSSGVVSSCLSRQWATQLNQRLAHWSLSLSCSHKDGLSQDLLGILALSFIMKVHTDLVRCLVEFVPPPCFSFIWTDKQGETHEIPSEHRKTLFHCVRPVEHWHWWSKATVSIPWSQSKPRWTQSWPVCAEGWARQCECVIPQILQFRDWFCDELSISRQQKLGIGCLDVRKEILFICICVISKHVTDRVTLSIKLKSGILIKHF